MKFNAVELRKEIVKTWGEAGAHIEVFDILLKQSIRANNVIRGLQMTVTDIKLHQRGPDRLTLAQSVLDGLQGKE